MFEVGFNLALLSFGITLLFMILWYKTLEKWLVKAAIYSLLSFFLGFIIAVIGDMC